VFEFSRIAFETSAAIKFQSARSAELARGRTQTPPIGAALEHFQFVARMERRAIRDRSNSNTVPGLRFEAVQEVCL
jgi:hypothetical protein